MCVMHACIYCSNTTVVVFYIISNECLAIVPGDMYRTTDRVSGCQNSSISSTCSKVGENNI